MAKGILVSAFVLAVIAVMQTEAAPHPGCGCPCATAPPLTLPLPLPAQISLGKVCQCTPIQLKPTVAPACGCPAPPALNPLLLKQLLPLLLPALLGQASC